MKITAVLITKDSVYPQEVLDSVKPHVDEIIVETNCPSIYRRYELAKHAKHNMVYVQDDDCIIDIELLKQAYNGHLTNFITSEHRESYEHTGITLVGWGTLFPTKMLDFRPYLDVFGENPLFLSQTDRVFTYLNQPHNSIVVDVKHLPRATDDSRMSTQPDHWENLTKISEQLKSLQ